MPVQQTRRSFASIIHFPNLIGLFFDDHVLHFGKVFGLNFLPAFSEKTRIYFKVTKARYFFSFIRYDFEASKPGQAALQVLSC